jgi:hypothetical protein
MKRKKVWIRPQLIVLSRGRPEENVLLGCKTLGMVGPQRPADWACRHPAHGLCLAQANS